MVRGFLFHPMFSVIHPIMWVGQLPNYVVIEIWLTCYPTRAVLRKTNLEDVRYHGLGIEGNDNDWRNTAIYSAWLPEEARSIGPGLRCSLSKEWIIQTNKFFLIKKMTLGYFDSLFIWWKLYTTIDKRQKQTILRTEAS